MSLLYLCFPGGSGGKEPACNVGGLGSMPELRRSPGEGNGYPLQYSGLENAMDGGPGGLQSMELQESDTIKPLTHINKKSGRMMVTIIEAEPA